MAKRVYYTARWRALRKAKLQAQPWCEICARRGRVVAATVVDHKRSIASGGDPFPPLDGLASMCARCHNAKTAARDNPHAFGGGSPIAFKGCDANGLPIDDNHPFIAGDTPLKDVGTGPLQPTGEVSADLIRDFF